MKNITADKKSIAKSVAADLSRCLYDLEAIGSLTAAAHLSAAIDSLYRDFDLQGDTSVTD